MYREFKKEGNEDLRRGDFLIACSAMTDFGREFNILQDDEVKTARETIEEYRKNKFKKEKIIFIPEMLYQKVPPN